jgi:hypothetical protein
MSLSPWRGWGEGYIWKGGEEGGKVGRVIQWKGMRERDTLEREEREGYIGKGGKEGERQCVATKKLNWYDTLVKGKKLAHELRGN